MTYRQLTPQEVQSLEVQGCRCNDWALVKVAQEFDTKHIENVQFSGNVTLGAFSSMLTLPSGAQKHSGIYNAHIHQCSIGNNVYISNIQSSIAGYTVDDNAIVENVGSIYTEGLSTFGNGLEINTVNESGERAVPMYNELTAQVAYVIAFGHNDMQAVDALKELVRKYAEKHASEVGYIGKNVRISTCSLIKNVNIGEAAVVEDALRLTNGSVNSTADAPCHIGSGVIAQNFIMCNNSRLSDGALVHDCFVGQGVHLGRLFSAEHSLFFANSECLNGEVCSIFAGPYTVSHHKSTLLIAGTFSFYNAGSGTNQSNHMYKLGPIHQGVLERGCKTGSNSYLMHPTRIGAFSVVLDSHKGRVDSSLLPFSYLVNKEDVSYIIPGMNLRSVGPKRDVQKWIDRDKRKGSRKLDLINNELLTPYTVGKIISGIEVLKHMLQHGGESSTFPYNGAKINRGALIKGILYYEEAVTLFIYNSLAKRLAAANWSSMAELQATLLPSTTLGTGSWHDLSGLLVPTGEVDGLFEDLKNGKLQSVEQLVGRFEALHADYENMAWAWTSELLQKMLKKSVTILTVKEISNILAVGMKAEEDVNRTLKTEAVRDIELLDKICFDMNSSKHSTDDISFVKGLERQIAAQHERNIELIKRLEDIL